jgi:hypothetical protein
MVIFIPYFLLTIYFYKTIGFEGLAGLMIIFLVLGMYLGYKADNLLDRRYNSEKNIKKCPCPYCGRKISIDSAKCKYCGKIFKEIK